MASGDTEVEDSFIIDLIDEISESHDSKTIPILIKLDSYLDTLIEPNETRKAIDTIYSKDLIELMLVELKRDFTNIEPNSWIDGVSIIRCLFHILSQFNSVDQLKIQNYFQKFITNSLYLACQLENYHERSLTPNFNGILTTKESFYQLEQVLDILERFSVRFAVVNELNVIREIIKNKWMLQLFVTNNEDCSKILARWLTRLIDQNPKAIKSPPALLSKGKSKPSIVQRENPVEWVIPLLEESIYYLSSSCSQYLALDHLNCVVSILTANSSLVQILHSKYKGLKLLVLRWSIACDKPSSSSALKSSIPNKLRQQLISSIARLMDLLDRSYGLDTSLADENKWAVVTIQSWIRGWLARKHLREVNQAFGRFQAKFRDRKYRERQERQRQRLDQERSYAITQARGRLWRQKLLEEAQLMQVLSPALLHKYMLSSREQAATRIQARWRGYRQRLHNVDVRINARRTRAVLVLQKYARAWLSQREIVRYHTQMQSQHNYTSLWTGLDSHRRQQLNQQQNKWIAQHKHEFKHKSNEDRLQLYHRAQESLTNYLYNMEDEQKAKISRDACISQIDSDFDLLVNHSPSLTDLDKGEYTVDVSDQSKYLCKIRPIAHQARLAHEAQIRPMKWWQRLMQCEEPPIQLIVGPERITRDSTNHEPNQYIDQLDRFITMSAK